RQVVGLLVRIVQGLRVGVGLGVVRLGLFVLGIWVWLVGLRIGILWFALVQLRVLVGLRRQKGQQELGAGRLGRARSLPCPREPTRRRHGPSRFGRQHRGAPAQPGRRGYRRDRRIRLL